MQVQNFGGASLVPWGWRDSYGKTGNFGRVGDKSMSKMYKKAGVGREGDICIYDCDYCTHSINFFKLTNVMSFCGAFCKRQLLPSKYFEPISIGSASRDSNIQKLELSGAVVKTGRK